jgi:nucleoside-diphosphate-sugar epimerase
MTGRALVAGGAGFIGSNLCERLLGKGWSIVCVDNLSTGRKRNIINLAEVAGFEFVEHDITEGISGIGRVDAVFHLASPASPPAYLRLPVQTLMANGEGTMRLLDLSERCGARMLYASTSEVYGDPIEHPQREDSRASTNPVGPRSMYHEGKRYGEAITRAYWKAGRADARIVRIFNTYGPRSDPEDGRVVPNFVCQALAGRPLTVYGNGSQTRSLCHVTDLVSGLVSAMEKGHGGEVYNLGNPEEHTVREYAERIIAITGSASPIESAPDITGEDPRRRRPDISKARDELGWVPRVSLDEGLRGTIAYFREELAMEVAAGG